MAKKSRRSSSRKMKHTRKHKTHRRSARRSARRRGGAEGAPVDYHLAGSWPSRMSLGQGADYFKYHEGQHNGGGLAMGAYPAAVLDPGLPSALRGPAHIGGLDRAIAEVRPLCDPPNCPGTTTGGRRRNKTRRNKSRRDKNKRGGSRRNKDRRNKTRRNKNKRGGSRRRRNNLGMSAVVNMNEIVVGGRNKRNRRRNGGALGYAPFPSTGMLLGSEKAYAQAGLNPEWKTAVEFTDAKIRDTQ
jgi:hypothetical protein